MNDITLHLESATKSVSIGEVTSFIGTDASGSFGIQPGRARFITVLDYGLARFRDLEGTWRYLACPGAVLHYVGDDLFISTRRYLLDTNFTRISAQLAGQLAQEETELQDVKGSLQRMEYELYRRLRQLDRGTLTS